MHLLKEILLKKLALQKTLVGERQLCQILNAVDILMTIGVYIVRIT